MNFSPRNPQVWAASELNYIRTRATQIEEKKCFNLSDNENCWMIFISVSIVLFFFPSHFIHESPLLLFPCSVRFYKLIKTFSTDSSFVCLFVEYIFYPRHCSLLIFHVFPHVTDTEARDMEVKHYTSTSSSVFTSWKALAFALSLNFSLLLVARFHSHYWNFG